MNAERESKWRRVNYYQNREKQIQFSLKYSKTPKGKMIQAKMRHRRRRQFSSDIILNKWFPESQAHHINPDTVIYIPSRLHRSVYHNLRKGLNMNLINRLAFEFYFIKEIIERNKNLVIGKP